MIYGYARVSTGGQSEATQVRQLRAAGAKKVFREVASGVKTDRPQLHRLLGEIGPGDVMMVTRLDRLARSTAELLRIAEVIAEKDAGLQSLEEPWADTTTPAGRMVLTVFAGVLTVYVVVDALSGAVTTGRMLTHLPVVIGAVLAIMVWRSSSAPRPTPDGVVVEPDIVLPQNASRGRRRGHLWPTDGSAA